MTDLTWRLRGVPAAQRGDLWWILVVGGSAALVLGWALTLSVQAAGAFVAVVAVIALHQHDRRWGIAALFALWFLAPFVRRVLGLTTGLVENDPLSLAPFLATGAIAALELIRVPVPSRIRVILLLAAAGFAVGLPMGFVAGPRAAVYAFVAYLAGLSGAVLGLSERISIRESTLRRVLLFGLPAIAAYAIAQRALPLPSWDVAWLEGTDFGSIGAGRGDEVRVFGSLNSPGTLAPLLALSLLCYLTITRHRMVAFAGAVLLTVALSLTLVRSAWVALIVAALAHVVASRGRSARLVLGVAALTVAATLALAPVSATARDVVNRFETIGNLGADTSASDRSTSFCGAPAQGASGANGAWTGQRRGGFEAQRRVGSARSRQRLSGTHVPGRPDRLLARPDRYRVHRPGRLDRGPGRSPGAGAAPAALRDACLPARPAHVRRRALRQPWSRSSGLSAAPCWLTTFAGGGSRIASL